MKKKINIKNILAYLQGNLRYKLFYTNFAFLLRKHIREQIQVRINSMDKTCYDNGECVLCGCQTTALQMADKPCNKPCYPRMLTRSEWWLMSRTSAMHIDNRYWKLVDNKFETYE